MTIIRTFIAGGYNEFPLARLARLAIMAGIGAGAVALSNALPGTDLPGDYDAVITMFAVPVLASIDKWARR